MKFLITGATGNVGGHLVEQLHAAGHKVRALTRNAAKANFPAGVEVVVGDLTQPQTIIPALEGVTGLHLINFGGDNYAPLEVGEMLMTAAKAAGVQRVTVLLGGEKGALETAVEASGLAWTFLQPVEFMNGMLDYAASIRDEGIVRAGFVNRKSAMVHEADIAAVAAAALTQDGHGGKTYTITGGEVLTPRDVVHTIGTAIGRDIRLIALTEAEAREKWRSEGYPDAVIEFFVWAHGNTPEIGYTVAPTVEQVTGHAPRTFAQWASENAAAFKK